MTTDLQKFGQRVRARREELGLTQLQVAAQGGPSNTTQTKIEGGEPPEPSNATLRKVDSGLRWLQGSARALLRDGLEPTPLRDPWPGEDDYLDDPAGRRPWEQRGSSTVGTRFRNTEGGITELTFNTNELLDAMRRGAQPIEDFTTDELLIELLRRYREGTLNDQAQKPRQETSSTVDGSKGRGAGSRSTSMTDDELAVARRRMSNDLIPPVDDDLLAVASSDHELTPDERERIAEIDRQGDAGGDERDTGDLAEPLEDPRDPQ